MLKTTIKLRYLKLDKAKFTKTFLEALDTANREAARAWLRAVIVHVPVWTGQARGSLRPLGQFLRVAVPIVKSPTAPEDRSARGAGQGSFKFSEHSEKVTFEYSTSVVHYLINEFYDHSDVIHLISPVPWRSFKAGKKAYKQYMHDNLKKKLPKLKSYIIREVVEIGGS